MRFFALLALIGLYGGASVHASIHLDEFLLPELSGEGGQQGRASLWGGLGLGGENEVIPQVLLLHAGYYRAGGKSYVPVLHLLPLLAYGLERAVPDSTRLVPLKVALKVPSVLIIPASGLRLSTGMPKAYVFVGHRFDVFAPHFSVAETLEAGLTLFCLQGSVYHRFTSVRGLRGNGATLGFTWTFEVD